MRFETERTGAGIRRAGDQDGFVPADLGGKSPFTADRDPAWSTADYVAPPSRQAEPVRPSTKPPGNSSWITRLLSSAFRNIIEGFALSGAALYPSPLLLADDQPHRSGLGKVRRDGRGVVWEAIDNQRPEDIGIPRDETEHAEDPQNRRPWCRHRTRTLPPLNPAHREAEARRIEDNKPVWLMIDLPAGIHRDLVAYAEKLSRETGQDIVEPATLIGPMLARFMASDRAFAKLRRTVPASDTSA